MKNIRQEKIEYFFCVYMDDSYFWVIGSLQCNQAVPREYGGTPWNLEPHGNDALYTVGDGFFILTPHGVENVCEPEEVCELC